MTIPERYRNLHALLTEQLAWPGPYLFKVIVPAAQLEKALALFPEGTAHTRPSKNGRYVSVNAELVLASPDAVVAVYLEAEKIEGVVLV